MYCKERRRDDYYEVDLPSLLATNDIENFRYFYYFFRRDAFLLSTDGTIFLDEVLKGSADYAKVIGDDLKDNVYKAMKKVAEGFFSWSQNGLDIQSETARETVQKCTMLLLYRFLFLLYAEGKGLLDLKKPQYQSYSFYKLKNEVKEKHDGPLEQRYLGVGTTLWSRLKDTFRLINQGSESFGIDKNVLNVPAYNGGLFDPPKNPELEKWMIGDTYLSEAIDLLSRSKAKGEKLDFVDYSTLEIRHLGSIYEGLLEYKLRVAEDEMVVNGGEWVKLEEYNKDRKQKKVFLDFNEFDRVNYGQIYLATDKGERKATGSYYTPDYIVNYIVKNTVGPVVDEKWKDAQANKKSFVDATLSVKVLDPAMGSGHFLVGSIEFLSEKLLLAVKKDIDNGRFSDESHLTSDWARREVVAHCIYGVDLNLMAVELAKVGLWLTTISKEKPLSFLDHRLKQGNSLIGAKLIDLPWYPDLKDKTKKKENTVLQKFEDEVHKPFVDKIVQQLKALSEIDDDTIEHINQKKALFEKLKENKQYLQIKSIADVYTAVYFGNETTEVNKNPKFAYNDLFWALKGDDKEWSRKTYKPWFKTAMEIARNKSFFHWELEFPEIFFEGGAPKENPGWDAVVGNPPYGASLDENDRTYLGLNYETAAGYKNTGLQFIERSYLVLMKKGACGLIVPKSLTYSQGWNKGVELILSRLNYLIDASKAFEEVLLEQVVIVFSDQTNPDFYKSSFFNQSKVSKYVSIPKSSFSFCGTLITSITSKEFEIYNKINFQNHYFKNISTTFRGVPWQRYLSSTGNTRILRGDNIERFKIKDSYDFIDLDKTDLPKTKMELLKQPKIISQNIVAHVVKPSPHIIIMSALDKNGILNLDTVNNTVLINNDYALEYLLCILNCNLTSWYTYRFIYNQAIRTMHFDESYVGKIPIRRISFTTPADRCAALAAEAKTLYSVFLSAPGADNLDRINRIDRINVSNPVNPVNPVQMVASLTTAPDSQKILEFIGARLSAAPEESDVVHNLLAYLSERMIEMNKEKNTEIKGFLHWFEGEIGAPIEELTNKTAIKEYYDSEFDAFAGVLAKNKKKLKDGYDPTRREPKEKLQAEFNTSVGKLAPLLKRIEATDGLIDQIVYKLYGLTEDEIKIVEKSISGGKDAPETEIAR